jgi:hypothetical protein
MVGTKDYCGDHRLQRYSDENILFFFSLFSVAATVVEICPTHLVFPALEEFAPPLYLYDPALL